MLTCPEMSMCPMTYLCIIVSGTQTWWAVSQWTCRVSGTMLKYYRNYKTLDW